MSQGIGRILLAEDNANDVELTQEALSGHNLANAVDVVRDGQEALDYLYRAGAYAERDSGDPIVILLDLKMPKVDGLEVLRKVKADPALRHIPVVMLTSSREEQDLVDSYRLGVNAYVVKPVDFTQFVDAVRQTGGFWAVLNRVPREVPGAGS
jgi:CheY-like chemotaxis protein